MIRQCYACGRVNPEYAPWAPAYVPTMTERVEKLMADFKVVGELLVEYRAELDLNA